MEFIETIEQLESAYGTPGAAALRKVANRLTPEYHRWVITSKFCILSTVGPDGTDGSPRGDSGPVVQVLDEQTLALPDWRGNNRIDTLRNIVHDPRISLMFMVAGSNSVVRINGRAKVTVDAGLRAQLERDGNQPRSIIIIKISEVYSQCARALMRADLWNGKDESAALPTIGEILAAMTSGEEGGTSYDCTWESRAKKTLW